VEGVKREVRQGGKSGQKKGMGPRRNTEKKRGFLKGVEATTRRGGFQCLIWVHWIKKKKLQKGNKLRYSQRWHNLQGGGQVCKGKEFLNPWGMPGVDRENTGKNGRARIGVSDWVLSEEKQSRP